MQCIYERIGNIPAYQLSNPCPLMTCIHIFNRLSCKTYFFGWLHSSYAFLIFSPSSPNFIKTQHAIHIETLTSVQCCPFDNVFARLVLIPCGIQQVFANFGDTSSLRTMGELKGHAGQSYHDNKLLQFQKSTLTNLAQTGAGFSRKKQQNLICLHDYMFVFSLSGLHGFSAPQTLDIHLCSHLYFILHFIKHDWCFFLFDLP